jgi:putative ABC transport system permease protein
MLSAFPSAIGALRANMARSLLTALGIIIGVAAVIAIVALGEGASAQVAGQLAGLGVNVLTISPGSTRNGGVSSGAVSSNTLKASDATAIAAISGVSAVSPVVSGNAQVIAGSSNWSTRVQAVLPAYLTINAWTISQARSVHARRQHQLGQRRGNRPDGLHKSVSQWAVAHWAVDPDP